MLKDIENYIPKNEQEKTDKKLILQFKDQKSLLYRENLAAHYTSSSFIINSDFTKVLFAFHNIYQSFSWSGGHNDGDADFMHVALKEAEEELGVKNLLPLSENIEALDCIYVLHHIKNNCYVSDHLHLNVTYIFIGDENEAVRIKPDENSAVEWIDIKDLNNKVTEPDMMIIYNKLLNRAKELLDLKKKG